MKRFQTQIVLGMIASMLVVGFNQDVLGKGPRNKVTVDFASPSEAMQGVEETVYVNGSGFDDGSKVSFLVTGTTDDSQVSVIEVDFVSPSQLKARIRPKESALVTDYDIEVRTASGRKGKGTTLFRVKQNADFCQKDEDPVFPSFVYLSSQNDIGRFSIFLSSAEGCDQVPLVDHEPFSGTGVDSVRLVYREPYGIVAWTEAVPTETENYYVLWAMTFEVINDIVLTNHPVEIRRIDGYIGGLDLFDYEDGSVSIAYVRLPNIEPRQRELVLISGLDITDLNSAQTTDRLDGTCLVRGEDGACVALKSTADRFRFNEQGDEVVFSFTAQSDDVSLITSVEVAGGALFASTKIVASSDGPLNTRALARDGDLLPYWYQELRRNGRPTGKREIRILSLSACSLGFCSLKDGSLLAEADESRGEVMWQTTNYLIWTGRIEAGMWGVEEMIRFSFVEDRFEKPIRLLKPLSDFDTLD